MTTPLQCMVVELLPRPEDFDGEWNPQLPTYHPTENAGIDLSCASRVVSSIVGHANATDAFGSVKSNLVHHTAVVRTGLRIALPRGYHMRVASRSGMGFKQNIVAFPGTIDNSYRGEIMIRLDQYSEYGDGFEFEAGSRIAQGILFEVPEHLRIEKGVVSMDTSRGDNGFGSSGV